LFFGVGCSTTHYRESADKEAYSLIADKSPSVEGMTQDVSIEYERPGPLDHLPTNTATEEDLVFLGDEAANEFEAPMLSLEQALAMAFKHSRDYQNQKEFLYLEALNLTLDRHRFTPIFSGTLGADFARSTRDEVQSNALGTFLARTPAVAESLESLTGTPAQLLNDYASVVASAAALSGANQTDSRIVNEGTVSGEIRLGMGVLLKGGGRLALNLTSSFLRFVSGGSAESAISTLSGSFVQPLLRGGGRAVTLETLTQAERDLLYELRRFTRFRKTFAVDVASRYYRILNARDQIRNNYRAIQSSELTLLREEAMAEEGVGTLAAVGRAKQNLLQRQTNWNNAVQQYNQSKDTFKIFLGLSTDVRIMLDDRELDTLLEAGVVEVDLTSEEATEVALVARLDLATQDDRAEDARRQIRVVANALQPDLNFVLTGDIDSKDGNRFLTPDFDRARFSAGLDVDLPFDRKAERNNYRRALINLEQEIRSLDLAIDNVKLDVRDAWRNMNQARSNFEIALIGVDLNQNRVDEQELRAEIGEGDILDQVDAQNSLTASQNDLTTQIVAYRIALIEFWRDMGILFIKENGQWEEIGDVNPV